MSIIPLEQIETTRLLLRRTIDDDAEVIFREYAQDAEVTRYLCWRPHTDIAQTKAFIQRCSDVWREGAAFPYAIVHKASGRLMGMIEVRIDGHRAEIGYVLARAYWGNGYVSEAAAAIVCWASSQPSMHRVWAYCDVENLPSQRVLEKAGMEREGLIRRWALPPNMGDVPRDCYFYSHCGRCPEDRSSPGPFGCEIR